LNTDIAQLINEAVTKAKTPKRITIELHIEKALPRIPVDNELLLTALTNLLQNSIQAIKNKGRIDIRAEKNENHVVIMVIDNGSGMDKKTLENIFSPFYSETEQGMGLGLAYVKKIIDAHNGKISVESKKGKGSKFVVALPMST
jgi:signal transduction histidine kinase